MGLFDIFKTKPKEKVFTTISFDVVGTSYHENELMNLAQPMKKWEMTKEEIIKKGYCNKRIYQYYFTNNPVNLVPEPTNKHDKNAIAVYIAGQHVGYVSREENIHIKEILTKHEISDISALVSGGKYKTIYEDGKIIKDEDNIVVTIKIRYCK